MLESLQCGLSWLTILNKRDIIRQCFEHFNVDAVAQYTETDIERIMSTEGMLKSRKKIESIINNAQAFQRIQDELDPFANIYGLLPIIRPLFTKAIQRERCLLKMNCLRGISKDLKTRGFKFVGPVTIYSHLQASGLINDHGKDSSVV